MTAVPSFELICLPRVRKRLRWCLGQPLLIEDIKTLSLDRRTWYLCLQFTRRFFLLIFTCPQDLLQKYADNRKRAHTNSLEEPPCGNVWGSAALVPTVACAMEEVLKAWKKWQPSWRIFFEETGGNTISCTKIKKLLYHSWSQLWCNNLRGFVAS